MPRPAQAAGLGVEERAGPARASADRRRRRGRRPRRDIGELTSTRSRSSPRSTSALVGEWTPPSMCASPSITTGAKKPGMAHDAATASATRGRRSPRPNTTRRPSDCRTAQIHSGSAGHASGSSAPMPSEIMSVLTVPSGSSAAARASGRAAHGRRAARARVAARSAAARGWRAGRSGGGLGIGPSPRMTRCPSAESGRSWARAKRSGAGSPARSEVPEMDPAEVPTITDALPRVPARAVGERGQHPGVEGAAGHAAGAEHQTRRAPPITRADRTAARGLRPPGGP